MTRRELKAKQKERIDACALQVEYIRWRRERGLVLSLPGTVENTAIQMAFLDAVDEERIPILLDLTYCDRA